MSDDISAAANQPQVKAQVVVSLLDDNTTTVTFTSDIVMTRFLLDQARIALDHQAHKEIAQREARVVSATNGDVRRIVR